MIGNMKMCQIGEFALAIGILLESFGFHGREAAILLSKRCGQIGNVKMDAETLRLYRPGWNR